MRSYSSSSKYASNLYYFTFVPLSSCSFKYMLSKSILIGSGFRPSRPLVPLDNNVKSSYWNLGRKIWKRRICTHEICGGYTHAHNRLSKTPINNQITFVNPYKQIILQRPVFLSSDFFLVHSYTMWAGSELHFTALTEHLRSNKLTFTSSAVFLTNRIV